MLFLVACTPSEPPAPSVAPSIAVAAAAPASPVPAAASPTASAGDCTKAKNTCPTYAPSWASACPTGRRCITFVNACVEPVALAYQVGCDGDGKPGAPQCDCTTGPLLAPGRSTTWTIVDGGYTSCLPSWKPACLTAGLAVLANPKTPTCTKGTRVEFTAGNTADVYDHFDAYNVDVEKEWYSVPVHVSPDLSCAHDSANHDCRPLWCGDKACPDAYATPTTGGCPDGRSPQAACQDTFSGPAGYTVTFCPAGCTAQECPSCEDAKGCP